LCAWLFANFPDLGDFGTEEALLVGVGETAALPLPPLPGKGVRKMKKEKKRKRRKKKRRKRKK
jgi:hypothetical protein